MNWIRRIGKSDEQKAASLKWNLQHKLRKAARYGYRSHSAAPGHKSLTKCSCVRTSRQHRFMPDPKPTAKYLQMLRRNMIRQEARV